MYQDAARQTERKVCDVMNLSHIYEYLVVTLNHVIGNFALTWATACCVCETGTYESDAKSSTVCVDQRTCDAGNYTSAPDNNSLNPKCDQCAAGKFKEDESPTPPLSKSARAV